MPDYGKPGRLASALDAAIARDNKRPHTPMPVCGIGGCGLRAGHVERAGTDHQPILTQETRHA